MREEVVDAQGQPVGFIDWTKATVHARGDGATDAAAAGRARETLYQVLLVVTVDDASCVGDFARRYAGVTEDLRALAAHAAITQSYDFQGQRRVYVESPMFGKAGLYALVVKPRPVRAEGPPLLAPEAAAPQVGRQTGNEPPIASLPGASPSVALPAANAPPSAPLSHVPPAATGQVKPGSQSKAQVSPPAPPVGPHVPAAGAGRPAAAGTPPARPAATPVAPVTAPPSLPTVNPSLVAAAQSRTQAPSSLSRPPASDTAVGPAKPASAGPEKPQPAAASIPVPAPRAELPKVAMALPQRKPPVAQPTQPAEAPATRPAFASLTVPSEGPFTGLLVDARGLGLKRSISPLIKSESGEMVYGRFAKLTPELRQFAQSTGIVSYLPDPVYALKSRAGVRPLVVRGLSVEGANEGNVIISDADATRVRAENSRTKFLTKMNVAILK